MTAMVRGGRAGCVSYRIPFGIRTVWMRNRKSRRNQGGKKGSLKKGRKRQKIEPLAHADREGEEEGFSTRKANVSQNDEEQTKGNLLVAEEGLEKGVKGGITVLERVPIRTTV